MNQYYQINKSFSMLRNIYATSVKWTSVYTLLCLRKTAYNQKTYNSVSLSSVKCIRSLFTILRVNRCSITEQIITQKPHTWTPWYKVETQCGWKPPAASRLYLSLIRISVYNLLYWCSLIPVCRLQPAEGFNLLSFSKIPWKGAPTPFFSCSSQDTST